MPDEPGGWELKRIAEQQRTDMREGFAQINQRLDQLASQVVSKDAFQAEQRRVDERFAAQGSDIADEKTARTAEVQRLQSQIDKVAAWFKWGVSVLVPVLCVVLGWLLTRGAP